uniref:Branchpoint-bridging protein n=1 Tax=Ciona savignyi TaxID=51511 RepID=H2ZNG5_CIOSA
MESTADSKYLPELMAEKDSIDPSFVHAVRLITSEIDKVKNPTPSPKPGSHDFKLFNIYDDKYPRVDCNIRIPVKEFPRINFVGRLIGPGGSTLKGIQEATNTKIAILGKGSLRDKSKEDELLKSAEPKYGHLKHPLHVRISAIGTVDQAYTSIGRACSEVSKLLVVEDEDEYIAAGEAAMLHARYGVQGGMRGSSRGAPRGARGGGRGVPRGSSSVAGVRGSARGARGGVPRGSMRGSQRGASRGGPSSARGGLPRMPKAQLNSEAYGQLQGYDFGETTYDAFNEYDTAYDAYAASAEDVYADPFADGSYGVTESYDAYSFADKFDRFGNGTDSFASKPAYRGKIRGGSRGRSAGKPY